MGRLAEEVQSRLKLRVKGWTTGIRLARGVGRDMVELEYGKLRCVTLEWSKALRKASWPYGHQARALGTRARNFWKMAIEVRSEGRRGKLDGRRYREAGT